MAKTSVLRFERQNIAVGFPVTWNFMMPPQPNLPCSSLRAHLIVRAWMYRPPMTLAEGAAPNANLNITIDGASWRTGLGDGTEKVLVDRENIVVLIGEPRLHTILFELTSGLGAVEATLEVDW